ncbi:Sec1-like protein [Pholiota molesta]|nr:Sec1-like protein [Pholiota molesta]
MKVLLLDTHTTPIVSLAATQSTLLSHQVYLTDRIDNKKRDRMPHMKCVCFLQNSEDSLGSLEEELKEPKYGEYYLYFSNILTKTAIERLAQVDEFEVVREVQEYFADYAPISPCLFSENYIPTATTPLYGTSPNTWDPKALDSAMQTITAVLLSLKKKPVIRYEKMSPMAKKLGIEIQHRVHSESALFDFRLTQVPPLLLILDRRNDPVTPLLSQWTYQAMVHELLGIHNGRVDLSKVPDNRPELSEITLTTSIDAFFQANYLSTFGDLGSSLKDYVQDYQSRSLAQSPSSINSIADMKRFVEEYPEFRKLGGNVSKHVALVGELSRLVGRDKLLEVGEVEQGLATSAGAEFKKTHTTNIAALINLMLANGVSRDDAKGRSALKGLKGVENVYTQHTPHLSQTLENLFRGRLKKQVTPSLKVLEPQDVIIFMIGGTTYEEARTITLLNQDPVAASNAGIANPGGVRLLLGGTCIHNSSSYIEMLRSAALNFPASVYDPPPESATNAPLLNLNLGGVNTTEDVKVKTRTGALLTIISAAVILSVMMIEFLDYRRVNIDTSIVVDKSRGEKLTVNLNITFPRVPCYLVSVDVMDISGEQQRDISHNVLKSRLDSNGVTLTAPNSFDGELRNDLDKMNDVKKEGCGSCYGGLEPESGCCNTCEEVRQAYINRGWSFANPDAIEQCKSEGWADKLKDQANEGCNVSGRIRVNKVVGNIHFSPGRSFQTNSRNLYELVPYLRDDQNRHDFSHTIHHFAFEGKSSILPTFNPCDDEYDFWKAESSKGMKKRMGLSTNPLDNVQGRTDKAQYMFQYFLKVVSTQFRTLSDKQIINTHQYSTTQFERDLSEGINGDSPGGIHVQHGVSGLPGAFFNFEISPILVVHAETRQSFAHFLTSTCAIVGGVLTVASLLDSILFATGRALKKSAGSAGSGYGGKLM